MASSAIKTGVEQGEENIPPNIPARNAPTNPLFLLFDSRLADGMRLNTPHKSKCQLQDTNSLPCSYTSLTQLDIVLH